LGLQTKRTAKSAIETNAADLQEIRPLASLQARGNREQAPRLVRAHHQRNLLWLADVIDLAGKVQPPQCHAQQELQTGHDPVAIADAHAGLGQV